MSNSDNSCILYEVKNDIVDIVTEEFIDEDNELPEICSYDDNDIKHAKDLGMTVEDMFEMYEEINNYESDEPEYAPEWPFDRNSGYCDEGFEESYYG